MQDRITNMLEEMTRRGSKIDSIYEIQYRANELISKDISLEEALNKIALEVMEDTEEFTTYRNEFNDQYITGISSMIYLPDYNNLGEFKLKTIVGNRSRYNNEEIDEDTLFDVASITKLFTLVLCFKLEELGLINLDDRIGDLNPKYKALDDFTFNDLIRLHGEIYTNGRIDSATSQEEAQRLLETAYLKNNTRSENKYTDIGALIIGETISKVISEKLHREMSYDDVMYEFLFKKIGINHTPFNPKTNNVSGNGRLDNLVHDPKSRLLGGITGHAGIFVNSEDLSKLARSIMGNEFLTEKNKSRLGEVTFPYSNQFNKGNLGIYLKTNDGLVSSFTPGEFSTGSYSHQGWTGSVASFDPNNLIHENILVNAILTTDNKKRLKNDKPVGFSPAFKNYQLNLTKNALIAKLVKEYYNRYLNETKDIRTTLILR